MTPRRIFLLDAYALIYRAYYALIRAPRVTSTGFNTSAIYGFCSTLDEILRKENPDLIAVCFDPSGGTFRHEEYAEYKAGRDKQPEDITLAVPVIKEILEAYNIPAITVPRYEADDVIGTLARRAADQGLTAYMITPDKDYAQLVTDHIFMYRPSQKGGFEIRGPQEVCEHYGLESTIQVIDLLALMGDSSDNIPGCPGVGEKTAVKLIREWGSVENMLDHAAEIKGALGNKIRDNVEQIKFSKFLATIKTDVPLDLSIDQLERKAPDTAALLKIYQRLEFRTLINRLGLEDAAPTVAAPPAAAKNTRAAQPGLFDAFGDQPSLFGDGSDDSAKQADAATETEAASQPAVTVDLPTDFATLDTPAQAADCVARALKADVAAVMLATAGSGEAMTDRWYGVVIATDSKAEYVALPADDTARAEILVMLSPLWNQQTTTIVTDSAKYDTVILRRHGIEFTARYFDISLAHYLIAPESKHDTADLTHVYLHADTVDYAMTNPERNRLRAADGRNSILARCQAAAAALLLKPLLEQQLQADGLRTLFDDIEQPFAQVLAQLEYTGVRIDPALLHEMSLQLTKRLNEIEAEAHQMAGEPFNLGSPGQVGELLFGRMALDPKAKKTKTGAYSTTEDILEKYRHTHPIVELILRYRSLKKLLATYIDALPKLINPATGRIHTTFNQTATATGRISSTNPNLQNIPIRTDLGREIRRAFVPDRGNVMLAADYSQIELRLMAELSQDPTMTEAFLSGEDIHRATAAKIFHKDIDDVTSAMRRAAKTANFGIIYGISAFGLAERLGIPRGEAKALIDGYLETYPGVKAYMDSAIAGARDTGAVTTLMGRRRLLPDINSRNSVVRGFAERNAINAPLQGSAADIIKKAMIAIHRRMLDEGLQSRMILQVHDELVFDVVPAELDRLKALVIECMEGAHSGRVPLTVETGVADNWLDAH